MFLKFGFLKVLWYISQVFIPSPAKIVFNLEQIAITVKYVFVDIIGVLFFLTSLLPKKRHGSVEEEVPLLGPKKDKIFPKQQNFVSREPLIV